MICGDHDQTIAPKEVQFTRCVVQVHFLHPASVRRINDLHRAPNTLVAVPGTVVLISDQHHLVGGRKNNTSWNEVVSKHLPQLLVCLTGHRHDQMVLGLSDHQSVEGSRNEAQSCAELDSRVNLSPCECKCHAAAVKLHHRERGLQGTHPHLARISMTHSVRFEILVLKNHTHFARRGLHKFDVTTVITGNSNHVFVLHLQAQDASSPVVRTRLTPNVQIPDSFNLFGLIKVEEVKLKWTLRISLAPEDDDPIGWLQSGTVPEPQRLRTRSCTSAESDCLK